MARFPCVFALLLGFCLASPTVINKYSQPTIGRGHVQYEMRHSESRLNSLITNHQFGPDSAALSDGRFVVAWTSESATLESGDDVHLQIFSSDGGFVGGEQIINTWRTNDQERPSIALLDATRFVVVYESFGQDGSEDGVFAQIFNHDGVKIGLEFQVNTHTTYHQWHPSVAVFSNGNFLVTWESEGQLEGMSGIYNQCFDRNGNPIGEEFFMVEFSNSVNAGPRVEALTDESFVLTWSDASTVWYQVWSIYGFALSSVLQAHTYESNLQVIPDIAVMSPSRFVIVWNSYCQDGSGWGTYGQLFDGSGNRVGAEFRVNTNTYHHQMDPSVSALGPDAFVVTWQSMFQDGSSWGIYGQLFCRDGERVGSEFLVNTETFSVQVRPSVSSYNGEWFVVVWEGDGNEIFGQIFNKVPVEEEEERKVLEQPVVIAALVTGAVVAAGVVACCCFPPRQERPTPVSEAVPATVHTNTTLHELADGQAIAVVGNVVIVPSVATPPK